MVEFIKESEGLYFVYCPHCDCEELVEIEPDNIIHVRSCGSCGQCYEAVFEGEE